MGTLNFFNHTHTYFSVQSVAFHKGLQWVVFLFGLGLGRFGDFPQCVNMPLPTYENPSSVALAGRHAKIIVLRGIGQCSNYVETEFGEIFDSLHRHFY